MFRAVRRRGNFRKHAAIEGTKSRVLAAARRAQPGRDNSCQIRRQSPYMPLNPAMKAPLHGPAVPSWAEDEFAYDRAEQADPSRRPRPPAGGWRHRRARPGGCDPAISRRPQSRAARGGGNAGRSGAGAGRRRHRQDARADLPHRPHSRYGPGAAGRNPLGHLHQQGGARDETAARPDARPGGRGHAVARHLSLHRRAHSAHPCRDWCS